MSLRKTAGLLAAFGLTIGLIGSGVGASLLEQVTGTEIISTGTFACRITAASPVGAVIAGDQKSVSYTAPQINSSAAGSAPFSFTVQNTGSIDQVLTVAMTGTSGLGGAFSAIPATPSPVSLAAGASQALTTGIQWSTLVSDDLGRSGSMTWTVNCGENVPAVIFDNSPASVPSNLPSYGVESSYYNELGAGVTFDGTARKLANATVTMSSWACQTGSWNANNCVTTPGATYNVQITFKVYAVGGSNSVGSTVATATQTFALPYRPSYDATNCAGTGKWFDGTTCKNGIAKNITFTFAGETAPNAAIFGIAYNTSTNGYLPEGAGIHPEDSLNIGVYPETTGNGTSVAVAPSVGHWLPDGLSAYVSPNLPAGPFAGPVTTFTDISPFGGNLPAVQITATN